MKLINRSGGPVVDQDIVEVIFNAKVPLSTKAIARDLDIDPTSEALLSIRDAAYESPALIDIDKREQGAPVFFDLRVNYVS